jgi:hypothetical protein
VLKSGEKTSLKEGSERRPVACPSASPTARATTRSNSIVYIRSNYEYIAYHTNSESDIYLRSDFFICARYFFLLPVQMRAFVPVRVTARYKCPLIRARQGLLQPTIVPGGGSARTNVMITHLYQVGIHSGKCGRYLYRTTQPPGTSLPPRAPFNFF